MTLSIGKSSLARAAAATAPRAAAETAPQQPTLSAREVEVTAIGFPKGFKAAEADAALVKSVSKHGVLEPLALAQTEDGKLLLLSGARRLAAAIEAGLPAVPAVVVTMTATEAASARREIVRFAAADTPVSASAEQPTAVGQAMPAWLL